MKKIIYLLSYMLLVISCSKKNITTNNKILWINSSKVPCQGVAPMQCLQTQTGNELIPNNWTLFYDNIEGFTYHPGNIYKLKVSVENLDPKTVPADASTKRYILKEIISKTQDISLNVNDIWVLTHINSKIIEINNQKERPRLEIKTSEMKILGKGVCNRFSGKIEKRWKNNLEFNPAIITTRMLCENIQLENNFLKILPKTSTYKISNNQLYLFNANGIEILRFKKID